MNRSPNKRAQADTLNKGASKYTVNAVDGPDSIAEPKYQTSANKNAGGEYNVNRRGGGYRGRGTKEATIDAKPNKDPRD